MRRVRDMGMHGLHNVRGDGVSGVWGRRMKRGVWGIWREGVSDVAGGEWSRLR